MCQGEFGHVLTKVLQIWAKGFPIFYLSATVPPGTPGRVRSILLVSACQCSSVLIGTQALLLVYPFFIIFGVSFFDAFLEPNGLPQGAQNRSKTSKIVFQSPP